MCGIAGKWNLNSSLDGMSEIRSMVAEMHHRGPDSNGVWADEKAGIFLGHARLSILDTSEGGAQPMHSGCGRYVISFNGEVYNFGALRNELSRKGHRFNSSSDTEVVLAAIVEWGLRQAVQRFVGMFAIAVWDREEQQLSLCRDRIGIKPLYYGMSGGSFVFASEMKPFRKVEGFDLEVNRDALTLLFRHSYIPTPYSIYQSVRKLQPGHILRISKDNLHRGEVATSEPYWEALSVVDTEGGGAFRGSAEEAIEELHDLLKDAVKLRMVSDVPLGAFLSGGIDSSTVISLMQAQSSSPVRTFSIGLHEDTFNEAAQAKAVANHIGTNHTEFYVSSKEAQDVIPQLPDLYDEPFSDSSQIPTFLVSKLAREHLTVALTGDGGDELFAGYNRHDLGQRIWKRFAGFPAPFRTLTANALRVPSEGQWDRAFEFISPLLPEKMKIRLPGYRAHKLAEVIGIQKPEDMYFALVSHWREPEKLVIGGREPQTNLHAESNALSREVDFREKMMYLDLISYLPEDILAKVDRASMGASLEARVPLIDHRVVEFAWSLPLDYKIREGEGKWVLRKILEKYVPRELFERPKMGFGIPIGSWLKTDLRDWAENLLDEGKMRDQGYLNAAPIRQVWEEHLAGKSDWGYLIWDVLMFQGWLERWEMEK